MKTEPDMQQDVIAEQVEGYASKWHADIADAAKRVLAWRATPLSGAATQQPQRPTAADTAGHPMDERGATDNLQLGI